MMTEDKNIARFLDVYQKLRADNLQTLKTIYRDDIKFVDPAHSIAGIDAVMEYFSVLYNNVNNISFTFEPSLVNGSSGYVRWLMNFSHGRLAAGKSISVEGVTFLQFDEEGKVYFHRDYFDLGAMLYEHLPLLGRIVSSIKRRLGK